MSDLERTVAPRHTILVHGTRAGRGAAQLARSITAPNKRRRVGHLSHLLTLEALPDALLCLALSHLDARDLLLGCALACKRLQRTVLTSRAVWRHCTVELKTASALGRSAVARAGRMGERAERLRSGALVGAASSVADPVVV